MLALASVVAILAYSLWNAPSGIMAPWDVFTLMDGGYRINQGQAPGSDFANPIGPLTYVMIALGMRMQESFSLAGLVYGNMIFLAIVSTLAWTVARRRLPASFTCGFTVFIAFLVTAVRPLGFDSSVLTYAMLYNRYSWALYSILLILIFLQPLKSTTRLAILAEGALGGVLLGLLFYSKLTYFAFAVFAVVLAVMLYPFHRRLSTLGSALVGFLAVAIVMWLLSGVSTVRYIQDFMDAARSAGAGERLRMLLDSSRAVFPVAVLAIALVIGILLYTRAAGGSASGYWRIAAAATFVGISSVLIAAGNAPEHAELPALLIIPLLLLVRFTPILSLRLNGSTLRSALGSALMVGLTALVATTAGPIVVKDVHALRISATYRDTVRHPPQSQSIDSAALHDLVIPASSRWPTAYRSADEVPQMINSGLDLLRRNVQPSDSVFTMALTDPFSMSLGLPSPRSPLWWDLNFNFDEQNHPDADHLFAGVAWVMIPTTNPDQGCCQQTVVVMQEIYADYLDTHFTEDDSNADWTLLKRDR